MFTCFCVCVYSDGGSPARSNTTQLLVNVKDVNDNAPRFYASLFQESVLENVPPEFSIVRVSGRCVLRDAMRRGCLVLLA